jgi:hypothetical protein
MDFDVSSAPNFEFVLLLIKYKRQALISTNNDSCLSGFDWIFVEVGRGVNAAVVFLMGNVLEIQRC